MTRANACYPCSRDAGEVLRRKGFTGPLHVIPLGVTIPPEPKRHSAGPAVVGFLGRLEPYKGAHVALRAFADRRGLLPELEPLGQALFLDRLLHGTEEVAVVVEHLELEARGLADDLLDLVERLLVLARDLDDDVLVARGDARLAEAELVDTTIDGVLRLRDGLVADVGLDLRAKSPAARCAEVEGWLGRARTRPPVDAGHQIARNSAAGAPLAIPGRWQRS